MKTPTKIPVTIVPSDYEVAEWFHLETNPLISARRYFVFIPVTWEEL